LQKKNLEDKDGGDLYRWMGFKKLRRWENVKVVSFQKIDV
jgi:hypothetical protein